MSDKPTAFLVTAAIAAPLCALCILIPVIMVSAGAGIAAWFDGVGLGTVIGVAAVFGILAYAAAGRIKANRARRLPPTREKHGPKSPIEVIDP